MENTPKKLVTQGKRSRDGVDGPFSAPRRQRPRTNATTEPESDQTSNALISPGVRTIRYYPTMHTSTDTPVNEVSSEPLPQSLVSQTGALLHTGDWVEVIYMDKYDDQSGLRDAKVMLHPRLLQNIDYNIDSPAKRVATPSTHQDAITLVRSVTIPNNNTVCKSYIPLNRISDAHESSDKDRHVVVCLASSDGFMTVVSSQIKSKSPKATAITSIHEVQLNQLNEFPTNLTHTGPSGVVIGTNLGNIYVLKFDIAMNAIRSFDILSQYDNSSWIASLIETGAMLLGFKYRYNAKDKESSRKDSDMRIIKCCHIPAHNFVCSLSSSRLRLWLRGLQPGSERVGLDMNVSALFMDDILRLGVSASKVHAIDMLPLAGDDGSGSIYIVFLSTSSTDNISDEKTFGLWMHVLSIKLDRTNQSPFELTPSLLSTVLVDGDVSESIGSDDLTGQCLHPVRSISSNRLFVGWTSSNQTLKVAYLDGLSVALAMREYPFPYLTDSSNIPSLSSESSGIAVADIADFTVIPTIDALCILKRDGTLFLSTPELQGHPSTKLADGIGATVFDPLELLLAIGTGSVNHKQVAKSVVQKLNSLLQDSEFHDELIKDASYIIAGSKRPPLSGSSNVSLGRAVSLASSGRTPIRMTSFTIQNLEKKVICLRRLITALSEWKLHRYVNPAKQVLQNVLFAHGLYLVLQDSQQNVSNQGLSQDRAIRSLKSSFLDNTTSAGLEIVKETMHRIVLEIRSKSKDQLDLMGLTIADAFFEEVAEMSDVMEVATQVLRDVTASDLSKHFGVYIVGYLVILVSAINQHIELYSRDQLVESDVAFLCNFKVRQGMFDVIAMLHKAIIDARGHYEKYSLQLTDKTDSFGYHRSMLNIDNYNHHDIDPILEIIDDKSSRRRENLREIKTTISDLSRYFFHSYELEALCVGQLSEDEQERQFARYGQHMSSLWRGQYHQAKDLIRSLLQSLRYTSILFPIASDVLDFDGIFDCYELSGCSQRYERVILRDLESYGDVQGSHPRMTYGCYALSWLETHQKSPEIIFEFGSKCPKQLQRFLSTRPHLSWLYHISRRNYSHAASDALLHGRQRDDIQEAKIILSIAKLSARLASDETKTTESKESIKEEVFRYLHDDASHSLSTQALAMTNIHKEPTLCALEADRQLALLKAQTAIQELLPRASQQGKGFSVSKRLTGVEIVMIILEAMENVRKESRMNHGYISPNDLIMFSRIVCIGLSVLTLVDAYESRETIDSFVLRLWVSAIMLQTHLWTHLCTKASNIDEPSISGIMTNAEESEIFESVFAQAVRVARSESVEMARGFYLPIGINASFIPLSEANLLTNGEDNEGDDGQGSSLLDQILRRLSESQTIARDRMPASISLDEAEPLPFAQNRFRYLVSCAVSELNSPMN